MTCFFVTCSFPTVGNKSSQFFSKYSNFLNDCWMSLTQVFTRSNFILKSLATECKHKLLWCILKYLANRIKANRILENFCAWNYYLRLVFKICEHNFFFTLYKLLSVFSKFVYTKSYIIHSIDKIYLHFLLHSVWLLSDYSLSLIFLQC